MSRVVKKAVLILKYAYHCYLMFRIWCVRKKKVIRFAFLVQELTQWKTERLYQAMLAHPRFEPILCISPSLGYPGAEKELIEYCKERGYDYIEIDPEKAIGKQVKVDIAMHEKPYLPEIHKAHRVDRNIDIIFVVISYYMSTIVEKWVVNQKLNVLCWRQFLENESCREAFSKIHKLNGVTYKVTGIPVMDDLLQPKEELPDVWQCHDGRKRIIYAPHHTIADMHWEGIGYSTFLDYCDFMLEMRDKYKDKVYFVFKPHPSLWDRLVKYWGEEKTKEYYAKWDQEGVSRVEGGKYMALFKYSDAMIHDCGSYTVEYMYTCNPVMYLVRDEGHTDNMVPYAKDAFNLHYHGRTKEDIEHFILNVIEGHDEKREAREAFKERNLVPPYGKSACENIIDSILGIL